MTGFELIPITTRIDLWHGTCFNKFEQGVHLKKCFALLLVLTSFQSFANTELISVKERLRLSLWYDGLSDKIQKELPKQAPLPEELEKVLKKQ
jgi:hypothetical protein